MKKLILAAAVFAAYAYAQTPRSVLLTWEDIENPTGTTYSVYRASSPCGAATTFTKIASAVSSKTYSDSGIVPGHYCYQVTAVYDGIESLPSNNADANVKPKPPKNLVGQGQ